MKMAWGKVGLGNIKTSLGCRKNIEDFTEKLKYGTSRFVSVCFKLNCNSFFLVTNFQLNSFNDNLYFK